MRYSKTMVFLTLLWLIPGRMSQAQDWPQWRGPNRDGKVTAFQPPANWPTKLVQRWKIPVGKGDASPVVDGQRIYLLTRQHEQELVRALDLRTGRELWQARYDTDVPHVEILKEHNKGPFATPLIQQGRLYTLGVNGVISCFQAATGKVLWRKEATGKTEASYPIGGHSISPLIVDGLLIVPVGGGKDAALTAFDASTGEKKWQWVGAYKNLMTSIAFSSPIVATVAGVKQLVMLIDTGLVGLAPQSGQELWKFPFPMDWDTIVSPVFHQGNFIISGQKQGLTAIKVALTGKQWKAEQVWQNQEIFNYMSSPVIQGDRLFGFSPRQKGRYFCVDAKTGQALWQTEGRQSENAALLTAGDYLFILQDDGTLLIVKTTDKNFDVLQRYQVADSATWAHPVILRDRILIKDATSLTLWGLK